MPITAPLNKPSAGSPEASVPVWDVFVRLFHWALVALMAVAAITGFFAPATWINIHVIAGLAIGALVLMRIVWGFTGSRHARFADFARPPSVVLDHARHLASGQAGRHLGHNPLGGVMVLGLLLALIGIVATGLIAWGGVVKSGPFAADLTYAFGELAKEAHELIAFGLLGLIGLHIAGALFESWRTRENLVRAMVTGRKRPLAEPDEAPSEARRASARPFLTVAVVALLGGGLALASIALAARPAVGLPPPIAPIAKAECGACHFAYPASLLPKASWAALIDGLDDHFGENASFTPEPTAAIRAYLTENAAETADTKAANRLRAVDPKAPFTITQTPFWRRTHDDIPDATFEMAAIGGKGNCAACHGDAETGRFHPAAIRVPVAKP